MPAISQYFIKTGMVWLIVSVLLLAARQMMAAGWLEGPEFGLRILFYHTLTVGWITQIIIGVSVWMFPRYSRDNPRGADWIWWTIFVLLNLGLLLRAVIEPSGAYHNRELWTLLLITGGWMQAVACVWYVIMIWPRVKAPGKKQ